MTMDDKEFFVKHYTNNGVPILVNNEHKIVHWYGYYGTKFPYINIRTWIDKENIEMQDIANSSQGNYEFVVLHFKNEEDFLFFKMKWL